MSVKTQHYLIQHLRSGEVGKVISIQGQPCEIARIASLGLQTGAVVSVTRGGITSIVQLENGNRLCLRISGQLEIVVETI